MKRTTSSGAVTITAVILSACTGSQPLLPPGPSFAPRAGEGTVIAQPFIAGCAPTSMAIAHQQGSIYRVVTRVGAAGHKGGRAVIALPPGTYHATGATCVQNDHSVQRVYAPYPKVLFHLAEPAEFSGSLATFTVNAGEIVDIGALWFDRPSASSDQGNVIVIPGDASTMADLVKERPELGGRVVQRPAVAVARNDLPKS